MAPDSYLTIQELLMRYGVEVKIARNVAMNALRNWETKDLKAIFDKVKDPRGTRPFLQASDLLKALKSAQKPRNVNRKELENGLGTYFRKAWPSVFVDDDIWLSAPRDLMHEAIKSKGALCVNEQGDWKIRSNGYVAISHVWIEGLQRDEEHQGVPKSRIDLIFYTLKQRNISAPWVWLDVLSIPGSGSHLTNVADDLLKIDIINTLAQVYDNADSVVIFDSLAWRLASTNPVEVAVVLSCGLWMSRLWTIQEVMLAKRALVITGDDAFVEWGTIVGCLNFLSDIDKLRYRRLYLSFATLAKIDAVDIKIRDFALSCKVRETGNDVDYARAFFPLLGLTWKQGMTRETGMQDIFWNDIEDATRMMFLFGVPRLSISPTWAPRSLTGLEGVVTSPLRRVKRGVQGMLPCAKISSISGTFEKPGKKVFNMATEGGSFQCFVSANEDSSIPERIMSWTTGGSLHIVLPDNQAMTGKQEFALCALLVGKADLNGQEGFEANVLCAVMITSLKPFPTENTLIMIRHGIHEQTDLGPELYDAIQYKWYRDTEESKRPGPDLQAGEQLMHRAVRNSDLALVQKLVQEGESILQLDGNGFNALHIAASRGETAMVKFLIGTGVDLELRSEEYNHDTALSLAAQYNKNEIIELLAGAGADVNTKNVSSYSPLMIAALEGHIEAVRTLIALGADIHCGEGTFHGSPLMISCGRADGKYTRFDIAQALLDAGVHVNGSGHPSGWTPLHRAAGSSSEKVCMLLIQSGANIHAQELGRGWTPLKYAIQQRKTALVRALLDRGARRDIVFENGWTPVHFAASSPDFEIMGLLLQKPINVNVRLQENGWTPLHLAVFNKHKITVKMLLEAGADPGLQLDSGKTAWDLAGMESSEIASILRGFKSSGV